MRMVGLLRGPRAQHTRVFSVPFAAVSLAALVLAGCGGGGAGASSGSITLYNGQHPETTAALVAGFEKSTGIKVIVRSDDEDVLTNQLVTEGSASPADVIYTENTPALQLLAGKGLLAPIDASTLAQVPSRYNSPDGKWVGVSARVSVMIYNTDLVKTSQLPTSVLQLAEPRWKGKLALAPAETDFQPVVTAVAQRDGQAAALAWLKGLQANAVAIYPDNETVTSMVNSGHAAIGIINQYYWYRERVLVGASGMHSALAYFAPGDPGYVVNVSGAGVLASSHHKADAQRFVAYLTSKAGQEIIAHSDSFEYAIGSGVTTAQGETPLDQLAPDPVSLSELGDGSSAVALLQEAQLL